MSIEDYYPAITKQLLEELKISRGVDHAGEQGRSNETALADFLASHLPSRFSLTTGKVVGSDGTMSKQTDIIIRDRLNSPALFIAKDYELVPIETTVAVVSVKTSLDKGQLRDALAQLESVRRLEAKPVQYIKAACRPVDRELVLRPRAVVFAFQSSWRAPEGADEALKGLLAEIEDDYRPNGVCILDQGLIIRRPYTKQTRIFREHVLFFFLAFLTHLINSFPVYRLNLEAYFPTVIPKSANAR